MEVIIQEATIDQLDDVFDLLKGLSIHHRMEHKFIINREQFKNDRDHYGCLVAVHHDQVIGIATYFYTYHTWVGRSIYLDDFFVLSDHRKQGIGSQLFEALIHLAQSQNCHRIRWQVAEWNTKAIAFYERYGAKIDMEERSCNLEGEALRKWK